jgi:hypothetical protein
MCCLEGECFWYLRCISWLLLLLAREVRRMCMEPCAVQGVGGVCCAVAAVSVVCGL